jgi:hypothetical protein
LKLSFVCVFLPWICNVTAQGVFNFLVTLSTVAIAIFNFLLWRATADMKQASIDSAEAAKGSALAAKESASAAKIALQIDRPYLVIESVELRNFWPVSRAFKKPVIAKFVLRNHGKGTAVNPHVRARLDVVDFPTPRSILEAPQELGKQYPTLGQYYGCENLRMREQAIPAGSKSALLEVSLGGEKGWFDRSVSFLSDSTFASLTVESEEKSVPSIEIVLHILVLYKDVIGNSDYSAESVWTYLPSRDPEVEGAFSLGQWATK